MVRVYMSKAMAEAHTPAIDRVIMEWGPVDDKAVRDGKLYSSKAPLQSLLGVPAYILLRPIYFALSIAPTKRALTTGLRILCSAIPGIIFAGLLLAWSRRRAVELGAERVLGTGVGLAIALGTMIYPYALTFTGHLIAAFAAGGAYLAIVVATRTPVSTRKWRILLLLAGLGAGAAPFAEYPAALVAVPAIIGGMLATRTWEKRIELLLLVSIGGAPPFLLGLWAHHELWGSAFKTGYAFLENGGYRIVHGSGFFGVAWPKPEAFAGSMFSSGTGLFFFSPILIIGLFALVARCFDRRPASEDAIDQMQVGGPPPSSPLARPLAFAALCGFVLEALFISGHQGWRGGWTVGPRYIIPVAPVLGVWVIEALAREKMRAFIAAFGAISVVTTGFAAALYPHLSDVYTNPLRAFLLPSYLRGEASYGIAHAMGLQGHAANLVHLVPIFGAIGFVAFAAARAELKRRAAIVAIVLGAMVGIVSLIPEKDPLAAQAENQRLWGFWEPPRKHEQALPPPMPLAPDPGLVFDALQRWKDVKVEAVDENGTARPCLEEGIACRYGGEPWQHFGPELIQFGGAGRMMLFMHPIRGSRVRASVRAGPEVKRAVLRYGLSDASVESANKTPVEIEIRRGSQVIRRAEAANVHGLYALDLVLTSTDAPLTLELASKVDGSRVFGWDLELYR
jgi:hypothetical protein